MQLVNFFNLVGGAFIRLAFLAPLTWPLLVAAGVAVRKGVKRENNGLSENRIRLIFAFFGQGAPSLAILIYGAMNFRTGAPDDPIPISLLMQLPIAVCFIWWCRRAWPFSLAMGLFWAAYSLSAAFVATLAISVRGNL